MKKSLCLVILLSTMLFSCNNNVNSSSDDNSHLSSGDETSNSSNSSTISIDYTKFDKNIIGTWYVHSSMMGEIEPNTTIVISSDYTLKIKNIIFNYIGVYENFEGSHLFLSESKITQFIVSYDSENQFIDWGFMDTADHSDMGVAAKEKLASGFNYSYVGTNWPMEQINSYLDTNGNVPPLENQTYYLLLSISQVHDEAKYAMIDIFNVSNNAEQEYINVLNSKGFEIESSRDGYNFYRAYDKSHIYAILFQLYNGDNLTIFVYNYSSIFKE